MVLGTPNLRRLAATTLLPSARACFCPSFGKTGEGQRVFVINGAALKAVWITRILSAEEVADKEREHMTSPKVRAVNSWIMLLNMVQAFSFSFLSLVKASGEISWWTMITNLPSVTPFQRNW